MRHALGTVRFCPAHRVSCGFDSSLENRHLASPWRSSRQGETDSGLVSASPGLCAQRGLCRSQPRSWGLGAASAPCWRVRARPAHLAFNYCYDSSRTSLKLAQPHL